MQSARVGFFPKRNGPLYCVRQSIQMNVMRSMSSCALDQTLKFLNLALTFIGSDERKAEKPECISPEIARQCARCTALEGKSCAFGATSFKYSPMAKVSQTFTSSCVSMGTKMDGDSKSSSARLIRITGILCHPLQNTAWNCKGVFLMKVR